ncbi:MAG: glycosyltransferase [Vulcanimicrobiota bacterium]
MSARPTAIIFTDRLLPFSQAFIKRQGEALRDYRPLFLGLRPGGQRDWLTAESVLLCEHESWLGILAFGLGLPSHRLLAELRGRNPAIIHAHFGPNGLLALPLARALGLPLVVTYHGYDAFRHSLLQEVGWLGRYYALNKWRLPGSICRILCVSEALRTELIRKGFSPALLETHYIGVDTDVFAPLPESEPRQNWLAFVGRLVPDKGCDVAIRVAARLQQTFADLRLKIVGDGPERPALTLLAESLGCNADFMGVLPDDEIRAMLARSKALIGPSRAMPSGAVEAFGLVFIEAQSCGTPVLATRLGGIPEGVSEERTGFLFPQDAVPRAVEFGRRLLADDRLWQTMSRAARDHAVANFDLEAQTRKLERIYDEVRRSGPRVP